VVFDTCLIVFKFFAGLAKVQGLTFIPIFPRLDELGEWKLVDT
jgi:hypothetical protein